MILFFWSLLLPERECSPSFSFEKDSVCFFHLLFTLILSLNWRKKHKMTMGFSPPVFAPWFFPHLNEGLRAPPFPAPPRTSAVWALRPAKRPEALPRGMAKIQDILGEGWETPWKHGKYGKSSENWNLCEILIPRRSQICQTYFQTYCCAVSKKDCDRIFLGISLKHPTSQTVHRFSRLSMAMASSRAALASFSASSSCAWTKELGAELQRAKHGKKQRDNENLSGSASLSFAEKISTALLRIFDACSAPSSGDSWILGGSGELFDQFLTNSYAFINVNALPALAALAWSAPWALSPSLRSCSTCPSLCLSPLFGQLVQFAQRSYQPLLCLWNIVSRNMSEPMVAKANKVETRVETRVEKWFVARLQSARSLTGRGNLESFFFSSCRMNFSKDMSPSLDSLAKFGFEEEVCQSFQELRLVETLPRISIVIYQINIHSNIM